MATIHGVTPAGILYAATLTESHGDMVTYRIESATVNTPALIINTRALALTGWTIERFLAGSVDVRIVESEERRN